MNKTQMAFLSKELHFKEVSLAKSQMEYLSSSSCKGKDKPKFKNFCVKMLNLWKLILSVNSKQIEPYFSCKTFVHLIANYKRKTLIMCKD